MVSSTLVTFKLPPDWRWFNKDVTYGKQSSAINDLPRFNHLIFQSGDSGSPCTH